MGNLSGWFIHCPPLQWTLDQLETMMINTIKRGKVPQHIAFVMDGNRRWARQRRMETIEGHSSGFEALKSVSLKNINRRLNVPFLHVLRIGVRLRSAQFGTLTNPA